MGVTCFLLLSSVGLAVTVQAQDCSKPTLGPHMNLKDTYILLKTFPDGTKVYLTCEVGYAPAGGSTVITCSAGSWSRVTLRCERKHCSSAGEITNGHVDYPEGTQFGDKALFRCDTGYTMVGNKQITCGVKGWMGRLPECEVVICSPPHGVVNGTFSPNNDEYEYGDVVLYRCKKHHTLIGSRSITCSEDGTFKPEPPTCRMIECKDPQIVNGYWDAGSRPPHRPSSTVTFKCNYGYIMKGADTQTCEISGEWSPGLPTCERKNCGQAADVTNGHVNYSKGTRFGDRAVITCQTGYTLVGNRQIRCGDKGWMGSLPVCEVVKCFPPPVVVNGTFSPKKEEYEYGDVVLYSCFKGYTVDGSKSATCSEDGTLKPDPPTCFRMVECEDPQIVNGDWDEDSKHPHRPSSKVTFKCNSGYIMKGAGTQTCDESGEWSPGLPTCEHKGHKLAVILGCVVGILVVVLTVLVIIYKKCIRSNKGSRSDKDQEEHVALS
ncbi:complement component receptor 1-like protein isoform X2 [Channa argus]|uniref:complement component receptor 1-like protein isoform X2 n=1 Tax=Channa argus TaxID=215402 RepID=UPI0035215F50